MAPDLGHVEHLAKTGEHPIGSDRALLHSLHQGRNVRAGDLVSFHGAQDRHDALVDVKLVHLDRVGLVARFRIVLDELVAQLFHCWRFTASSLLGTRVPALSHIREPVLSDPARLLYRQFAETADRGLATLPGIGAIHNQEDLAPSRRDLEHESRNDCVAELVILFPRVSGVNGSLRKLHLRHAALHSYPGCQEPTRSHQATGFLAVPAGKGWAATPEMPELTG